MLVEENIADTVNKGGRMEILLMYLVGLFIDAVDKGRGT